MSAPKEAARTGIFNAMTEADIVNETERMIASENKRLEAAMEKRQKALDHLAEVRKQLDAMTNDPAAPYEPAEEGRVTHEYEMTMKVIDLGGEPTKREPMFVRYSQYLDDGTTYVNPDGEYVLYEDVAAKITSGELRVVVPVKVINDRCAGCGQRFIEDHNGIGYTAEWDFCPGCSQPIVE